MSDLISRQAVIEIIKNSYYNLAESMDDVWAMVSDVEALLSAEAVEVVRCKDCRMTMERDEYIGRWWCSIHRGYKEDTYYCADGERKGGDDE